MPKRLASFYVAHNVNDRHYVRDIVCPALHKAKFGTLNPFYTQQGRPMKLGQEDVEAYDRGIGSPYDITDLKMASKIVMTDLGKIDKSDGIIALIKKASFGCGMEIFYCAFVLGKPVYIVCRSKYKGHPWLTHLTNISDGFIVPKLEILIMELKKKYEH